MAENSITVLRMIADIAAEGVNDDLKKNKMTSVYFHHKDLSSIITIKLKCECVRKDENRCYYVTQSTASDTTE